MGTAQQTFVELVLLKHKLNPALIFWLFLAAIPLFGQNSFDKGVLSIQTFDVQDGLEVGYVHSMQFDNEGWLWLSGLESDLGASTFLNNVAKLQWFDGYNFHTVKLPIVTDFSPLQVTMHKRSDGLFYLILESPDQQLLYLFDPGSFEFQKISLGRQMGSDRITGFFVQNEFTFLTVDRRNETYLTRLDNDLEYNDLFTLQSEEGSKSYFYELVLFKDHFLISEARVGIMAYSLDGEILKRFSYRDFGLQNQENQEVPKLHHPFLFKGHYQFVLNNEAALYEYNQDGMYWSKSSFEPFNEQERTSLGLPSVQSAFNDDSGNVVRFNLIDNTLTIKRVFLNQELDERNTRIEVGSVAKLASKNLENELFIAEPGKLRHVIFKSTSVSNFLDDLSIRSMTHFEDNKYLVGTEGNGLFLVDVAKNTEEPFRLLLKDQPFSISENRGLFIDEYGIWSNYNEGIVLINPSTHQVERFRRFPIRAMIDDGDKLVYGSVRYPLMAFDKATKTNYPLSVNDSLSAIDMIKFGETIFLTTNGGLFAYKNGQEFFVEFDVPPDKLFMLDVLDDYGLMISTNDGEVYQMKDESSKPKLFFVDDSKNPIASVFEDEQNNLWFATFSGLIKLNPKTKQQTRYSEDDGLSNNEFNRYSMLQIEEGGVFLGAIKGLNFFYPNQLKKLKKGGQVVLTGVAFYDSKTEANLNISALKELKEIGGISLPAENKYVKIQVAAKDVIQPLRQQMEYRLNNGEWQSLKYSGLIEFNNLAAGHYLLKVRMTDSEGEPFGEELELNIHAREFFYRTIWFILLCALLIVGISYYFVFQANKAKALEQHYSRSLLKVQEEERMRISRDLHDSVGQQLILLKNQANASRDQEMVNNVSATLEEVRSITRNLHPVVLSRLGLTAALEEMIRKLDENTEVFFSTELENIDGIFDGDEELNLYRIIQEALNNIIKHANAVSAKLTIERQKHKVLISIQDNGKGFSLENEQQSSNSLGLKTLQERIAMLNGKLNIVSSGTGTIISLVIPI